MEALREIFFWSIVYNFKIEPFHIQGKLNEIPDAVSRLNTFNGLLRTRALLDTNFMHFEPFCHHMSYAAYLVCFQTWKSNLMR